MKHPLRIIRNKQFQKRAIRIAIISAIAFASLNIVIYIVFAGRTYPNTKVGAQRFGNKNIATLPTDLQKAALLPQNLEVSYKGKTTKVTPKELGISVNAEATASQAKTQRSWLPIANLFFSHKLKVLVSVNQSQYDVAQDKLAQAYRQDPTNAEIVLKDGTFSMKPETYGYKLNEKATQMTIVTALSEGKDKIDLPTETLQPQVTQDKIKADLASLQKQQGVAVTFRYQGKSKKLVGKDISAWYVPSSGIYVLSDVQIKVSLSAVAKSLGVLPQNLNEAVAAAKRAVLQGEALDFTFVPMPVSKAFTYCVKLRGVDASHLGALESKLKATYADERGWSAGGKVSYTQVASGCSFTVWLAAADQMSSFGSICDAQWSCAVSPNVIINFDRWRFASTAWNASGGSLEDYRSMVINHETGHWLGFGHRNCPGAGQAAPVMQQQSIDLQGCKFNPWPLSSELDTLKTWLNI